MDRMPTTRSFELSLFALAVLCGAAKSFQSSGFNSGHRFVSNSRTPFSKDALAPSQQRFPFPLSSSLNATPQSTQESSSSSSSKPSFTLNDQQLDFTCGYLNKHHSDVLAAIAETFSRLGEIKSKRNSWSGGAYKIESAKLVDINTQSMELEVTVQERNKDAQMERVTVDLGKKSLLQR
jgi:Protein of unknown function (DUF2470)